MPMNKALKANIAVLLALGLFGCQIQNTTLTATTAENKGRFHAETGSVYVITDTRTNVQYLTWYCADGGCDGICVLVDTNDKPLLAGDAE